MIQTIDFTQPGGLYEYQDTLAYMQDAYQPSIDGLVQLFGDGVIVQGCVITGSNISDGFVVFQGQLMKVLGGALLPYVYVSNTPSPEQFADGMARNVYMLRQLKFTTTSTASISWSYFKNLPYKSSTLYDALSSIKTLIKSIVNVEAAVILSGCVVSAVTGSVSGTATISAGTVLMDGEIVNAQQRNAGAWPCWLKPDGSYVTADPGGTNVKFDYETSQRYKDVMKRFQAGSGEVVMSNSAADVALFDASSGLGKWKWLGWKICNNARSRGIIGLDNRTSNPGGADAGVWDALYNTLGSKVGTNKPVIQKTNLPHTKIDLELWENSQDYDDGTSAQNNIGTNPAPSNPAGSVTAIKTTYLGDDTPFDVRSGGAVFLVIERL